MLATRNKVYFRFNDQPDRDNRKMCPHVESHVESHVERIELPVYAPGGLLQLETLSLCFTD